MRQDGENIIPGMFGPNVEVMCIHGNGFDTNAIIVYENQSDFPNVNATILNVNGDGVVTLNSLEACLRFADMQIQKFTYKVFPNEQHTGILYDTEFMLYLENYLQSL